MCPPPYCRFGVGEGRPGRASSRAVILGVTGAIGGAVAGGLASAGWSVDVTGRAPGLMPQELVLVGVRSHRIDRSEVRAIEQLVGDGADLWSIWSPTAARTSAPCCR